MDIFNDLKNKNNNYSDKIELNKYTQSTCNSITKPESNITKQSGDNIINSVVNESINNAVDNGCVKYTKQEMMHI